MAEDRVKGQPRALSRHEIAMAAFDAGVDAFIEAALGRDEDVRAAAQTVAIEAGSSTPDQVAAGVVAAVVSGVQEAIPHVCEWCLEPAETLGWSGDVAEPEPGRGAWCDACTFITYCEECEALTYHAAAALVNRRATHTGRDHGEASSLLGLLLHRHRADSIDELLKVLQRHHFAGPVAAQAFLTVTGLDRINGRDD